jgi:NAD(P)-dependent dehydrogenase (short-subunit alcohol dehydrogenase family)
VLETGLSRRDVVVFGGAGALGSGVAAAFADVGAVVVGVDRAMPAAEHQLSGVRYETVDVLDDAAVAALFRSRPAPWAVINTIGGFAPRRPLTELDPAELNTQLQLNLVSAAIITKHALQAMLPVGEGRIVHTASHAAAVSAGAGFAYSVSKLGVLRLVEMAASELHGSEITVNCVVPKIIDTPANRAAMPKADHASWPKVHEIARSYIYLASPDSHLVNGAAIPV